MRFVAFAFMVAGLALLVWLVVIIPPWLVLYGMVGICGICGAYLIVLFLRVLWRECGIMFPPKGDRS